METKFGILFHVLLIRYGKRLLFILLAFLFLLKTHAQQTDSITEFFQHYEYQKVIDLAGGTDSFPADPQLLYYKAAAFKGLNKFQQAIPYYEKLLKQDSLNLKYRIELAECYQSLGNFKKTQKLYIKALTSDSSNYYLIQQLANSYYLDDDFTKAKIYYRKAYLNDSTFYLSKQLARCYDNLGNRDSSILYYKKAIALSPVDFLSNYRLANLYMQKKEYEKGILLADTFLTYDSTNIRMLKLSGLLYYQKREFNNSVKRFEKCVELNDTSDFTHKYLGYSYFKISEYGKAKNYLESAYLHDTLNTELCYTLGLSCDYSDNIDEAVRYLKKTLELAIPAPDFLSQIYQDYAYACSKNSEFSEALNSYLEAYKLTPGDTLLVLKIASNYDNYSDDKEKALKYYKLFMATRPKIRKPLPEVNKKGEVVLSYYNYAERRIKEIQEDQFWQGTRKDTSLVKESE